MSRTPTSAASKVYVQSRVTLSPWAFLSVCGPVDVTCMAKAEGSQREREIQNNGLMIIHFELNFSLYTLIQVSGSQLHCLKPVNIFIVLSLLLMTIWSVSFYNFHSTCFLSELISYYSSSVENACSRAFFSH